MNPTSIVCILALPTTLLTPAKILKCKARRLVSSGSFFCFCFVFLVMISSSVCGEINCPHYSPLEALFSCVLLFPVFLLGPVVPRRHVRTNYTAARHCSAQQRFCSFWKGPCYGSEWDFKRCPNSFWFTLMNSFAQRPVSSRNTRCVSKQSHVKPQNYRNGTLADSGSTLQWKTFFSSIAFWVKWTNHYFHNLYSRLAMKRCFDSNSETRELF